MRQPLGAQGRHHRGDIGFVDEMAAVGKRRLFGGYGFKTLERLSHFAAPGSGLT